MSQENSNPYSMPAPMPEYPPPPYRLGPLEGANLLCTLPSEVLRCLVPEPLVINTEGNAEGLLWIYLVHIAAAKPLPLPYHELGIFVPVTCAGQQGLFALALFLDESLPITIGREVWGFPKRFADSVTLNCDDNCCSGKLVHEGSTLFAASFRVTDKVTDLSGDQPARVYTHRMIPSWNPDQPSVNQLVGLNWISTNETRLEAADAKLEVAFPASSQLSLLNNMRCIKAWYSRTEACTLEGGEVVRDFLTSSQSTPLKR